MPFSLPCPASHTHGSCRTLHPPGDTTVLVLHPSEMALLQDFTPTGGPRPTEGPEGNGATDDNGEGPDGGVTGDGGE